MSRRILLLSVLAAAFFILPQAVSAATLPFFGPIIDRDWIDPTTGKQCALGWGALVTVINNIIRLLLSIAIVFIAPIMIAYAGFLFVVNPVNAGGMEKAKSILTHTIVGIVIALAGWLIVDAIMAVLYNPQASQGSTVLGRWTDIVTGDPSLVCLVQQGSTGAAPGVAPGIITGSGRFTFQNGVQQQIPHESAALQSLLSCMSTKLPAGVGNISSISDSMIVNGNKTFAECATGGCQHSSNSCHYGGSGSCNGRSYAVDFGDEQNASVLSQAASQCGGVAINEGDHLHVSVGSSCGCR